MSTDLLRAEAFIAHYASPYYDPAKAREYYLRTRELKGRTTSGQSDQQKEAWGYAKNQIAEREKADIKSADETRDTVVEQARAQAQATREAIVGKVREMLTAISNERAARLENLSNAQKAAVEQVSEEQKAKSAEIREAAAQKIAALPPIPKGVSDEQRAKLAARRAEQIASINGSAWTDLMGLAAKSKADQESIVSEVKSTRQTISDSTKAESEKVRIDATASREALSEGLKATVDKARSDYEARKEQIKAEYEATAQREYQGIMDNLPDLVKPAKKASTKKATKKKSSKVMPKDSD